MNRDVGVTNIFMKWRDLHKWRHGLQRGGGQGFCNLNTKAMAIKSVTIVYNKPDA